MFQNEFPLPLKVTMNCYFQINYSHCCTMFPCLKSNLKLFLYP